MTIATTAGLLVLSNIFMTFAWYAHLKDLRAKPLIVAILASWGIALFEYVLQVPANRIGSSLLTLPQLKIMQEVITLLVFVPFAVLYMKQPVKLDFLRAGLCLIPEGRGVFPNLTVGEHLRMVTHSGRHLAEVDEETEREDVDRDAER